MKSRTPKAGIMLLSTVQLNYNAHDCLTLLQQHVVIILTIINSICFSYLSK